MGGLGCGVCVAVQRALLPPRTTDGSQRFTPLSGLHHTERDPVMKLHHLLTAVAIAACATSSFADSVTAPLDLSAGNAFFGRNNTVGQFVDTYTFALGSSYYLVSATASSAASGSQDLDYSSLTLLDSTNATVATFAGNLGTDQNEFYSLSQILLAPGAYQLVVSGVNSLTQASYSGNLAISVSPVPEPETYAMLMAGLGIVGFISRRKSGDKSGRKQA